MNEALADAAAALGLAAFVDTLLLELLLLLLSSSESESLPRSQGAVRGTPFTTYVGTALLDVRGCLEVTGVATASRDGIGGGIMDLSWEEVGIDVEDAPRMLDCCCMRSLFT